MRGNGFFSPVAALTMPKIMKTKKAIPNNPQMMAKGKNNIPKIT